MHGATNEDTRTKGCEVGAYNLDLPLRNYVIIMHPLPHDATLLAGSYPIGCYIADISTPVEAQPHLTIRDNALYAWHIGVISPEVHFYKWA